MAEIELTKGYKAIVDDRDFKKLSNQNWHCGLKGKHGRPYAVRWANKREQKGIGRHQIWMHRQIMKCPPTHVVDHINGNGLDNRRENLRIVLYELNQKYAADKTNSRPRGGKFRDEPSL